ncbi:hypothetical protein ACJO5Y_02930 [Marinobacter sp. GN3S48]|uniref:hypothetical protein n=1 Tax=Marinobacter sp. GN3S48 TaxID=3382302 RepID=UPI00387B847F
MPKPPLRSGFVTGDGSVMYRAVKGAVVSQNNLRVVVASDINPRDGIGVEIYIDEDLILEIFRDDTDRTRTVTVFKEPVSLEVMEESISIFKREIPWDFIEYEE